MSGFSRRLWAGPMTDWKKPVWEVYDRWHEDSVRFDIADMPNDWIRSHWIPVEWLAANWGISLDSPNLEREVDNEWLRRLPCLECGSVTPARTDLHRCDPCFLRATARDIRADEEQARFYEFQRERRRAAGALLASLSPARRQLVEASGVYFSSPEQVFAESHGEW